jgi:G3E family GTPase
MLARAATAARRAAMSSAPTAAAPRVPVTIVTGALGAGKTTLLRWILTADHGKRIAVIENEFAQSLAGEGGIESLVLKDGVDGAIADGFYELANGCVCCSVRDGLVQTLLALMERRDRFDYVLVETSGLADPGPVASVFWTDLDDAGCPLALDGIVTVVDARHVGAQLDRVRAAGAVNETLRQLAHGDVVLLNKTDLLDGEAELAAVERRVRGVNAGAVVLRCTRGEVPLARILGLRAYEEVGSLVADVDDGGAVAAGAGCAAGADGGACSHTGPGHEHHHHPHEQAHGGGRGVPDAPTGHAAAAAHHHHVHDSRVTSVTVTSRLPVELAAFKSWVGQLLWERAVPGQQAELRALAAPACPPANDGGAGGGASDEGDDDAPPELLIEHDAGSGGGSSGSGGDGINGSSSSSSSSSDGGGDEGAGEGPQVFRGKGVLHVAAGGGVVVPHIFQSVHALFDVNPATGASATALQAPASLAAGSRLLFIGEGLDGPALQRSFDALCRGGGAGAGAPGGPAAPAGR